MQFSSLTVEHADVTLTLNKFAWRSGLHLKPTDGRTGERGEAVAGVDDKNSSVIILGE